MTASQDNVTAPQATFAGVATPLNGISLPGATVVVLAIVNVTAGMLAVDIGAGAAVRGSGSNTLSITGSTADVNAKLATLSYCGTAAGTDTLTVTTLDAAGTLWTPIRLPLTAVPFRTEAAPAVLVEHGTLTLDTRTVDGPAITLHQVAGSRTAASAVLVNTVLGARTALTVQNDDPAGATLPRLAIAGRVELDGATNVAGHGTTVTLARNASLVNEGSLLIGVGAVQVSGAGTLVNDGTIVVDGDGPGTTRIDAALAGTGEVVLRAGASLSLGAVAAGETVRFDAGAPVLHLAQPAGFAGVIAGFSRGGAIVLDGAAVSNAFYSTGTGAGAERGTLSLFNGQTAVGSLRFSVPEPGTVFQLVTDASGTPAIRLAAAPGATEAAGAETYRFFDATHGTQMLTGSGAERDQILATRPDLRYEGVAFGSTAPAADTGTVPVFRFFDTATGTHLLTTSATERDGLLGTRPDLVFEPNSTIFEHATAQAGDAAVYRFFDGRTGAHFFTADPGERASILATRPDMVSEGIAFYAPQA